MVLPGGRDATCFGETMTARNKLLTAPPYPVEQTLKRLGANLRTARLRRNLTIADMAEKIGTGERAVADAERGKPSTGVAVYAAMLWALDLLHQVADVAAPERDEEGQTLALTRERGRARPKAELNNDF
jgi:transcriptional regulator with XRE-family HTH domain